ncbi:hypothetical protein [Micromonospora haikouensis]|uniref:hypothetical protein n=1 Tax=Micromonospora haikouensis TaxID=686309 RepID=UPI0033F184E1
MLPIIYLSPTPLTSSSPPADPGISPGDWLGASIGFASLVATVALAFLIYRLQRKDARNEAAQRFKVEEEQKIKKERDERDRELRASRRERHKDDYQLAAEALLILEKAFTRPTRNDAGIGGLLTSADMEEMRVAHAEEMLERVIKNVTALQGTLGALANTANQFRHNHVRPDHEIQHRLRVESSLKESLPKSHTDRIISGQIFRGIIQREAAIKGMLQIKQARSAIEREWGT